MQAPRVVEDLTDSEIRVGDTVEANQRITDDGTFTSDIVCAERGDLGTVVDMSPYATPVVQWERTGQVTDVFLEEVTLIIEVCDVIAE